MFNDEELLVFDNKPITPALWPGAEGLVLAGQQPLQNPLKSYLDSLPSARSRQTVMERLRAVARLVEIEDAAAFPWHQLRFQHIDYIRARLIEKDPATSKRRSPATVNLTLAALRGIARYARNYNLMSDEEYRRICEVKPATGERLPVGRAAASGEISALVKVCQADRSSAGARDAAMLAVLYIGGVRRAELAGLDVADYTPDPPALKVRAGKGNKDRSVPLIGSAAAALDDWLALRGRASGPLFVPVNRGDRIGGARLASHAIYKILRKRLAQAGVEDLRPHDFRRTFVVICTNCGHHNVVDRQQSRSRGVVMPETLERD